MVWGVSTSAFQSEGAFNVDGRGSTIWDQFLQRRLSSWEPSKDPNQFYNNLHEDLDLMARMGIRHFRTSLAWSRILPEGYGRIEQRGVDHYHRFIDACLERGITPWLTLYHWDLPLVIQKERGGWTDRSILGFFNEYAHFCAREYGDRVKHWWVLNEPSAFVALGHFIGMHAPGKRGPSNFLSAYWHALLCQGTGINTLKAERGDLQVGTTFSLTPIKPEKMTGADQRAARRADTAFNRMFIEPLLGLGVPYDGLKMLKGVERYQVSGDEVLVQARPDMIGVQNYTRHVVRHAPYVPYAWARIVPPTERNRPCTAMKWEIHPKSLAKALRRVAAYPGVERIIVSENGAAFNDEQQADPLYDQARRQFVQRHIEKVLELRNDGVPVKGYFLWTFTDNLEWTEGYDKRFGIVRVDPYTGSRQVKASGKWYAAFLKQHQG